MFRIVRFWAVLICAAAVAVARAPAAAVPHLGDDAPAFRLAGASGGTLDARAMHGKAFYLNFFASWCTPCNDEAPDVAKFYKKYRSRGLAIVGIDEQEDRDKALGFARKYGWPFPIALDGGDAAKSYGAFALPVHVFVDKHGKISTYRLGQMDPGEIEDAIKKIL